MFYFRLGVAIYNVSSRLRIIGQVISIYLILCQLGLISSFIRVDQFFYFLDYILDYILKLCGFDNKIKDEAASPGVEKFLVFIDVLLGVTVFVVGFIFR